MQSSSVLIQIARSVPGTWAPAADRVGLWRIIRNYYPQISTILPQLWRSTYRRRANEVHVAIPAALRVVAFALADGIKGHIHLAYAEFPLLADRFAVPTVPRAVLVVAVVVADAIADETVRAFGAQIAVVAILAVKVALKVEALLVADAVVDLQNSSC